jgi:hypothetical protein
MTDRIDDFVTKYVVVTEAAELVVSGVDAEQALTLAEMRLAFSRLLPASRKDLNFARRVERTAQEGVF